MALINLQHYDNYANEPFNMRHGKPRGMLRCGYCDEYYEPYTFEAVCSGYGDTCMITVCKSCGEVNAPYEEE